MFTWSHGRSAGTESPGVAGATAGEGTTQGVGNAVGGAGIDFC